MRVILRPRHRILATEHRRARDLVAVEVQDVERRPSGTADGKAIRILKHPLFDTVSSDSRPRPM